MKESPFSEDVMLRAAALAEERFAHVDGAHPVMVALRELALPWFAREVEQGEAVVDMPDSEVAGDDGQADPVDLLQGEIKLPSLPQVVIELQQVIDNPESSAEDVAVVVSRDASLSAFLLKLVNSAFYNFPSQVDTISRAVTVVGTKQLSAMAMGASVLDTFKEVPPQVLDMQNFWRHSIAVGLIAQRLAEQAGHADAERFFVCGLLHDIGRLALFSLKPAKALAILRHSRAKQIPVYAAEAQIVGFDHAKLGGMLLRKWNFPFSLTMGVLYHHLPEKSEKFIEPHFVHVADIIAKGLGISTNSGFFVPPLSEVAWQRTGLQVEALASVEKDLQEVLKEMVGVLFE